MTCPICEGLEVEILALRTFSVRGITYTYEHQSTQCQDCNLNYFRSGVHDANLARRLAIEATIPHYINPSSILQIREQYMLSSARTAEYFQISESEWNDYEDGLVTPSYAMSDLMNSVKDDYLVFVDLVLASRPIST